MPEIYEYYCSKCETKVRESEENCPKCKHFLVSDGAVKIKKVHISEPIRSNKKWDIPKKKWYQPKFPAFCNTYWKKFIWELSILTYLNPLLLIIFFIVTNIREGLNGTHTNDESLYIHYETRYYFGYLALLQVLLVIGVLLYFGVFYS